MKALADIKSIPGVAVDIDALLRLRHVVRHIPERKLAPAGLPGGFVTRRRGRGLETNDIRAFSFGDDIRHIDHNTTARTGETHVRTFHDEREKTALLVADFRPSMLWGTRRALRSVAAAEALALAGWRVTEGGGRVGLIAISAAGPLVVTPRPREKGMIAVIGGLAQAHDLALNAALAQDKTPDTPLVDVLEIANRAVPAGGAVYVATGLDNPGDRFEALASALRARAHLTLMLIRDAFEVDAPAGSYAFATDTGPRRWASFSTRRSPTRDTRLTHLERLGVTTVGINAAQDPEAVAETLGEAHGYLP